MKGNKASKKQEVTEPGRIGDKHYYFQIPTTS